MLDADDFYGMTRKEVKQYVNMVDIDTLVDVLDEMSMELVDLRDRVYELEQKLDNDVIDIDDEDALDRRLAGI